MSQPTPKVLSTALASLFAELASKYGTPLYVYDAARIRDQYRKVARFDTVRFAQKACSNVHILRLLRALGSSVDCVSAGELERALKAGFVPGVNEHGHADIVYTADVITQSTLERVVSLGVPINAGSEDMVEQVAAHAGSGYPIWLRVNPGFGHGHSQKTNTGGNIEQTRDLARKSTPRVRHHQAHAVAARGSAHAHRFRRGHGPPGAGL